MKFLTSHRFSPCEGTNFWPFDGDRCRCETPPIVRKIGVAGFTKCMPPFPLIFTSWWGLKLRSFICLMIDQSSQFHWSSFSFSLAVLYLQWEGSITYTRSLSSHPTNSICIQDTLPLVLTVFQSTPRCFYIFFNTVFLPLRAASGFIHFSRQSITVYITCQLRLLSELL